MELTLVVPTPADLPTRFIKKIHCARVPIIACSPHEAVSRVLQLARRDRDGGADVHLCNAYTLALADSDQGYRSMLRDATLNLADGKSVAWFNRLSGEVDESADRIRGNDLFLRVVDAGRTRGVRHYLLGGSPEVVKRLQLSLESRFPGTEVVGSESPPFRPLTEEERGEQVAKVRESGADVVWVGLGTPKQDLAAYQIAREAGVVAVAIGAAFDFIAGSKPEAPKWMQKSGTEWLHRLLSEPRRLWRRYLFGNSRFVYAAYRYRRHQDDDDPRVPSPRVGG